ncbi:glycosyltransferase family 2 protein [Hyunsoonleella rubra]|uniref:Glycosyltransferase family 2 protein n=1 Tax=Hyunsoonleella rubra TaxID=1737062 RepID=A0ABW5TFL5_9FLAO
MQPLISVIVPNYNHEPYLRQRLDSIFEQTHPNFEVIILDDKSTDKSREIFLEYANNKNVSHCIINEENSGSTFKQWNKGITLAKGEYIWIAETDDFCEPNFLETVVAPMVEDNEVVLSFCQSLRVNSEGKVVGTWLTHTAEFEPNIFSNDFVLEGNRFIQDYLIHKNVIPNASAVLIKKDNIKAMLPLDFNPFMKYNADWFYYLKLVCNHKIAFCANPLNAFRYHNTSVIGRAYGESGKLKILNMELELRDYMISYLKMASLSNITHIKKEWVKGKRVLHFEIVYIFLKKKQYTKALAYIFTRPYLAIRILKKIFKKHL